MKNLLSSAVAAGLFLSATPAWAQDDAILAELRKLNARLETIEGLLQQLAPAPPKSISVSVGDPAAQAGRTGSRVRFYRMEAFDHMSFSIPEGEPDVEQVSEGAAFSPNEVRTKAGYPENVPGIAMWDGVAVFPAGKYEFQFGWEGRHSKVDCLGSVTVRALADGQAFSLKNGNSLANPDLLTVELAEGSYQLRFVAPTDAMQIVNYGIQANNLILRYRRAGAGANWITLTPAMLVPPAGL